jgi:hypothetical protein
MLRGALVAIPLLVATAFAQAAIPVSERAALLALYASTNGPAWADDTGWNGSAGTECDWYGIVCNSDESHVAEIYLGSNGLAGNLPPISDFTSLVWFDVSFNQLTGPVPTLLASPQLRYVYLGINQFSGPLPPLSGHPNLELLDLQLNQLSGTIPSLQAMPALRVFSVRANALVGSLPSFAGLTTLETFDAAYNQLTGPVPSLSDLPVLKRLRINDNLLVGVMPTPPNPAALEAGSSQLCANHLDPIPDAAWDSATGQTPWYQDCTPIPDAIFGSGFDP